MLMLVLQLGQPAGKTLFCLFPGGFGIALLQVDEGFAKR